MKWKTDWWGITIIAEDRDDNALIEKIEESLPKIASERYEEGDIEIETNDGLKSIILHR